MKLSLPLLALSLALSLALAPAALAEAFEGTIDIAIATPTQETEATAYLKGGHVKLLPKTALKLEGGVEGYPLINFDTKKLTLISPSEKYFLDMALSPLETALANAPVKFKKSGKTDTLAGHPAEEFVLDGANATTVSFWATKDFSTTANFLISLQKTAAVEGLILGRINADLIAQGYFPVKAEARDAKGNVAVSLVVLVLTPKKLDDKEFAIPDGFGKMSDVLKKKRGAKP